MGVIYKITNFDVCKHGHLAL